ncbi:MAG: AAA family ATPase [Fluviicola sp.]|nr:AAA family ATPase [Fluviicola sp.]
MRIERIKLTNFKIYKGENEIIFKNDKDKNISLIAGMNGFGKTTFLTSLIWSFYGGLMAQVEDKYRKDIKNSGGYEKFLETLVNKNTVHDFKEGKTKSAVLQVEVQLVDVMIPSIPCRKVIIKRTYDFSSKKETLKILIDGHENQLTKEVGYEVFINDFILPREIAKFFFFDAEKIVSLAEAKSKSELRSLSKAYSEVLGIKKYEDLKMNLTTLLTKLKRSGVSMVNKTKLDELIKIDNDFDSLIDLNNEKKIGLEEEITSIKLKVDAIQEKLIREGNDVTLEKLKELKFDKEQYKKEHVEAKGELKKLLEIVPIVIAGKKFDDLVNQVNIETKLKDKSLNDKSLIKELDMFSKELVNEIKGLGLDKKSNSKIFNTIEKLNSKRTEVKKSKSGNIILDYTDEESRGVIATYNYIKDSFDSQFKIIIKNEKDTRQALTRVSNKIKQAEARKNNPLAQKLREEKEILSIKIENLNKEKEIVFVELTTWKVQKDSNKKILSEYEKNYNLVALDKEKFEVTTLALEKLSILTARIKEEKKYSLQKSVMLGLKKLMHKNDFITNVQVRIEDDVMDIDLLDNQNNVIDKDTLSKGEQQLYATALLKALVDESGINFPVFIVSPLQKFDKSHSSNVIQQFYPTISEQVVLFPLLEKELSQKEYEQLKPNLSGVYLIQNDSVGSSITKCKVDNLFKKFNEQDYVFAN